MSSFSATDYVFGLFSAGAFSSFQRASLMVRVAACGKKDNVTDGEPAPEIQDQITDKDPDQDQDQQPLLLDPEKDEVDGSDEILEDTGEQAAERAIRVSHQDVTLTAPRGRLPADCLGLRDEELLDNYYPGLSGIVAVEEMLVQETRMRTANIAVGLVKLSDDATEDDAIAVENIFNARIAAQAEGEAWYPESCETWEKGVVTSTSNCVGMFVYSDDAQELADLFTEAFTY